HSRDPRRVPAGSRGRRPPRHGREPPLRQAGATRARRGPGAVSALRSLLFVPGNRPRMLEKALTLDTDALTPDMEDSVPPERKAEARDTVRSFLPRLAAAGPLVLPRINALGTPW